MRKNKASLPVKLNLRLLMPAMRLIILGAIIIFALFSIVGYSGGVLKDSEYFKIKDIIINKTKDRLDFSYFVGYNIFALDLKIEARRISELYPTYSNIRLIRVLPNRLFIGFTERRPIAYIKLYRHFLVDKDAVLFDMPKGQKPEESQLPVISGLDTKIFGAKPGNRYNIKELALALNIIQEVKINNFFKDYKVQKIDVASLANTSCLIAPLAPEFKAVEVKIGHDNIRDKIRILAGTLVQLSGDPGKIKYIDLRFKEPVIKFK